MVTWPAQGHTLTHHGQAAPSSTAAHRETKSPFYDARMKEAIYKDPVLALPQVCLFSSTDQMTSKFSHSIKKILV